MNRQHYKKSFSYIICCIFILSLILSVMTVYAAQETVVLNGPDESANKVFEQKEMFPGDAEYKDYVLNISHKNNIDVMFKADVLDDPDSEKLAEVLELKVEVLETAQVLYEGLMKDMHAETVCTLAGGRNRVTYRLTVSLDETVNDDYENKTLRANFSWRYLPESTGGGGSSGGSVKPSPGPTKLLRRAYVIGRPNDYFRPESPITRAETATIFARIFADYNEEELVETKTGFKDVAETEWYAKYIARCEDENIIFGHNNEFRPSEDITRAEFAAICVRFFERRSGSKIKPTDIAFTDFEKSHWAYDTIRKACANGYVTGYPDGTLLPDNTITRAEAVTVVNRMLERVPDKEYIDNNLHKLIDFIDVRDNTYWAYYEIFEAANTHYIRFVNDFAKWVD